MAGTIEKKLTDLGIVLPQAAAPVANYVPFVRTGNFMVVSGQLCFDAEGKLVAKGQLGGGVSIEDGAEGCAGLRHQHPGAAQGGARRSRQDRARGAARRLHQFGTRLCRRPQGHERRLRPDGRSVRRQGPPRPHHHRRRCPADGRCGRGRSRLRGGLRRSAHARLADRAPDRPPRPPRCSRGHHREHALGVPRRDRGRLRHRMRPADQRRRRGHGAPRRCARPADRWRGAARHHDGGSAEARRLQGQRRPHADPRRAVRSGRRAAPRS